MTEYEKLTAPFEHAEELIKGRVGNPTYDKIASLIKSSSLDKDLALNFVANLLNKEFASQEDYINFINRLMPELEGEKIVLAYICGMLFSNIWLTLRQGYDKQN